MALLLAPISVVILLTLLILLAILIGQWLRVGPIVIASSGAPLTLACSWLLLTAGRTTSAVAGVSNIHIQLRALSVIVFIGSVLLLIAAWALALADATWSRSSGWLTAIWLAIYPTVAATTLAFPQNYFSSCGTLDASSPYCMLGSSSHFWLFVAGYLVGPVVMLAYALRHVRRA